MNLYHKNSKRMRSLAIRCTALGVAALGATAAFADRGGGSIRAANRPEPVRVEQRAPVRDEAPRGPQHVTVNVQRDVHVNVPPPRAVVQSRDWDDHDVDLSHGGGFAHGAPDRFVRGQHFHVLPHHINIAFGGLNYFYDDNGEYYTQQGADYVVVQPPVGASVPSLPPGVLTVVSGPTTFYYLDGVFYVSQPPNFAVVSPPPGIVVTELPTGANQVVLNGSVCYQFNGLNYTPSVQDGVTVYTVTPS